jgi:hypothetical protein
LQTSIVYRMSRRMLGQAGKSIGVFEFLAIDTRCWESPKICGVLVPRGIKSVSHYKAKRYTQKQRQKYGLNRKKCSIGRM